jgi:hypothetical protein
MRPKNAPLPLWQEHASEYRAWANMMQRCKNEDRPDYHYYGGRGIEVCRQWANGDGDKTGFECFLEDLGKRPSPRHSLNRIDKNRDFEPGNVRWAIKRRAEFATATRSKLP